MTPKEALDQAAKELSIGNYMDFICEIDNNTIDIKIADTFITRALDLMWNAAIDAAADSAETLYDEGMIDKQSILKLKR